MKKIKNVTILYNTPDTPNGEGWESDSDTQESALSVEQALMSAGYHTSLLGINRTEINLISKIRSDVVFNLVEWTGKDYANGIEVIETLRKNGLRFTGTSTKGWKITCDKIEMKKLFDKFGIPTPNWQANYPGNKIVVNNFRYPVITKPAYEHCGIGIDQQSITYNDAQTRERIGQMLTKFDQPVLTEEYIQGREIQATILEKRGKAWVIPPAEVVFKQTEEYQPILTYTAKWVPGTDEFKTSTMTMADLDEKTILEIKKIAIVCHKEMEAWDYARLDIRLGKDELRVLEINNNPGIDYEILSGIGVSARAANLSFPQLVAWIVENAYLRFEERGIYASI